MDVFFWGKFCGIWEFDIISGDTPIRTNRFTMEDIQEHSCKIFGMIDYQITVRLIYYPLPLHDALFRS